MVVADIFYLHPEAIFSWITESVGVKCGSLADHRRMVRIGRIENCWFAVSFTNQICKVFLEINLILVNFTETSVD